MLIEPDASEPAFLYFLLNWKSNCRVNLASIYRCRHIVGCINLYISLGSDCWVNFGSNIVVVTLLVLICLEKNCVVVVGSPSDHIVNDCLKGFFLLGAVLATLN